MADAAQNTSLEPLVLEGAQVILPNGVQQISVRVEGGKITSLDRATDEARRVDLSGYTLAPALVDIHGDAFERQLMPRPNVFFPLEAALLETDRQLAGSGIATAYHALTLSWEPGLRSVARGREVVDALEKLSPRLSIENRVQLRWETFCSEAIPLIESALKGRLLPSLAFNDHTSMVALHPDIPLQERPFDHAAEFPLSDMDSAAFEEAMSGRGRRSGLSNAEFVTLFKQVWERRAQVPSFIDELAAKGRAAGAPMLSHDDSQIETRDYYRAHGSRISEFPMNRRTTKAAREAGDWIVFGAPNALRGGSHIGSPGAGEMVAEGLCDILASDYYYPAMLGAVARLLSEGVKPLPELWTLISQNPAEASGLTDRGSIAPGKRADLVVLDWPEGGTPAPVWTLCAGQTAFAARDFPTL